MTTSKSQYITEVREPQGVRTLLWDIETAPVLGYTWGAYEQNILWKAHDWYILTIAWKWLGEKKVHTLGLDDFDRYKKNPQDDYELVNHAWDLFNEGQLIVGHNSNAFDNKKAQARMIIQGFDPPSPYKEVDTLKLARRHFSFTTNKLGDVCEDLGVGTKLDTGGIGLWKSIVEEGDPKAWAKMKKYNIHDVELLEGLYLKLLPWADNHPNVATISDRPNACPKCLSEAGMVVRGYHHTAVSVRASYRCNACGGYSSGRQIYKTETKFV